MPVCLTCGATEPRPRDDGEPATWHTRFQFFGQHCCCEECANVAVTLGPARAGWLAYLLSHGHTDTALPSPEKEPVL